MDTAEYASYDALGLAELVAKKQVSPKELANTAVAAKEKIDGAVKSVVELYPDRIDGLDEASLGNGPFRGVPFLIKDVFGHGRPPKSSSARACARAWSLRPAPTSSTCSRPLASISWVVRRRRNTPMAATTESAMFGNTSNPWKQGYSAGGSTGGGQAAVTAGIVPIAHGSDIGGSIRIPASWCGGVGLKPSRMRVSIGPVVDEGGWGYSMNFVQAKTVRDAAAMLDCVSTPQPGDPFIIPKPDEPYASLATRSPGRLRVGIVLDELVGMKVDQEVAAAVEATGKTLAGMGHVVERAKVDMGGRDTGPRHRHLLFRLRSSARRLRPAQRPQGRTRYARAGDPVRLSGRKEITPARFISATGRQHRAAPAPAVFTKYDIWLSPTTSRVSEPWGRYNLSRPGRRLEGLIDELFTPPCQYTVPHNIMGTPAMSLPLAMHSTGVPIGVQIAARTAAEHLLLQLATGLETAMPWRGRAPSLHVSRT